MDGANGVDDLPHSLVHQAILHHDFPAQGHQDTESVRRHFFHAIVGDVRHMDMVIARRLEIDHVHAHTIPADDPATRHVFNHSSRYGRPLNDYSVRVAGYGQDIILSATLPN